MIRTPFCGYGTNALQNICFYDRIFAEILSRNGKNCKILHKGAGIMKNLKKILVSVILSVGLLTGNAAGNLWMPETVYGAVDLASVPSYTGSAYTVLNDNVPEFTEEDLALESFESYSELDSLGRTALAYAFRPSGILRGESRRSHRHRQAHRQGLLPYAPPQRNGERSGRFARPAGILRNTIV